MEGHHIIEEDVACSLHLLTADTPLIVRLHGSHRFEKRVVDDLVHVHPIKEGAVFLSIPCERTRTQDSGEMKGMKSKSTIEFI